MVLVLPFPSSPQNGQTGDASTILANQTAIAQSIQSFDGSQVQAGTIAATALATGTNPITRGNETLSAFVYSGCITSNVSGLNGTITGGVYYVNGIRIVFVGVGTQVFTANQDTYVDLDTNGNVHLVAVANGATAGMGLTANSLRISKVVTGASTITSVTNTGYDPLFNKIYPTSSVQDTKYTTGTLTNTGTAGGTIWYTNLGGIKMAWGETALQTIGGAAPQSATLTVVFPTGFFTTIQTVTSTGGPPGSNSQFYFISIPVWTSTTLTLDFNTVVGSAVGFSANFFAIGV